MKKYLLILFFGLFLNNLIFAQGNNSKDSAQSQSDSVKMFVKSPTGALLRSLVIPGWGQWYTGHKIKAGLALVAEGTTVAIALYLNRKAHDSPPGSTQREYYIDRRNLTFWILGGITLLSMLDAYIDAYLYDFDTGPDLAMRIGVLREKTRSDPRLGISFRAKF
ncbi:MAG: hypothetical protein D6813_01935 [Calditrichaeota bacterium]|nr:MAG: hypothetical protein D6813_01935 [Calditrichota bacterium]